MILRYSRRNRLNLALRLLGFICLAITLIDLLQVNRAQASHPLPTVEEGLHRKTRIFIASTHWNNEAVLRNHWNDAVVEIAKYFGPENVYVSIYESGSWDDTKGALRLLDRSLKDLGVARTITLDDTTHKDLIQKRPSATEPGWVETKNEKKQFRRIPYLAGVRNKALEPLADLATAKTPRKFDKILFLNDVYFSMPQLLELLSTNDGHYAAACALDFSHPPGYYDTFALRDINGEEPMMQTWPYFRVRQSRSAVKSNSPVSVASCWNGMIVMDAEPFYDKLSPLRFRGISDGLANKHLEGSECCLIHADNPYTPGRGVWLNPRVRVGYNKKAYLAVKDKDWLGMWTILLGTWENRVLRWTTTSWFSKRKVDHQLQEYEKTRKTSEKAESGTYCLINEMQVLVENGWAHV